MVEFDSTILPGREGSLTPQVKITGLHSGKFSKSITVESNASNKPRLVLTIKGYILPVLDVTPTYLTVVNGTPLSSAPELTLRTRKATARCFPNGGKSISRRFSETDIQPRTFHRSRAVCTNAIVFVCWWTSPTRQCR